MAERTLQAKLKVRSDTATNWQSNNPVLLRGEPAFETDTNKLKFGDGTSAYNDLPYVSSDAVTVEANPTDEATQTLQKLTVGNTTYSIPSGADGAQIIKAEMATPPSYSTAELAAMVGTQTTVTNLTNLSDIRVGDVVELPVTISNKADAPALITGLVKIKNSNSISMEVLAVTWSGIDGTNGVDYIVTNEQYSAMLNDGTLQDDALYYVIGTTDGVLTTANAQVITEEEYSQLLEDGEIDDTRLYYIEGTSDGSLSFSKEAIAQALDISVEQLTNLAAFAKTITSSDSLQTIVNNRFSSSGFNTTT